MATVYPPTRTVPLIHQLVMLIAIGSFAASASAQTTVTLSTPGTQVNADLTIQGGAAGYTDFSNSPVLASKVGASEGTNRRIFLKFDTQNNIPANAVIQSAQLYLVLATANSGENRPFTAFNVTQSFVTGQTNWYYFRSGQAWNNRGGDLGGNFGTTYVGSSVGSAYAFDLTDLVQRAVNGEFGSRYTRVALIDTGANTSGNYREFNSSRAGDPSVRPRLVITYGSGSAPPPAPAPPPPAPPPPSSGTTLRVMQYNIHKTMGSDGVCSPDRITDTIIAQNVQVASLNEVNFYSGTCAYSFDMSETLRSLMQQKTGVTWYKQAVNPNGVGNVLLSSLPLVSASSFMLDGGRGVAQVGVVVNGRTVNLFSTHIEYDNASLRPTQLAEAIGWLWNFSEPRVFMGDFNTWQDTPDYYTVTNAYLDGWLMATNAGTASSFNGSGATEGLSRIDYIFLSPNLVSVNSVTVPDTVVNGVRPSDHDPIVASLTIR